MRGLAPWPTGVGQVIAYYTIGERINSTSSWFLYTQSAPATVDTCQSVLEGWYLTCASRIAGVSTSAANLTGISVTIQSSVFAHVFQEVEAVPGALSGAQAVNVAVGWRWIGQTRGRGTASVMRLPSCPDAFVDESTRLASDGYVSLRNHLVDYLTDFNAISDGAGGTILHGCLHRIKNGVPLVPPYFDLTVTGLPSAHLLTIRRRLPFGSQVSPRP